MLRNACMSEKDEAELMAMDEPFFGSRIKLSLISQLEGVLFITWSIYDRSQNIIVK